MKHFTPEDTYWVVEWNPDTCTHVTEEEFNRIKAQMTVVPGSEFYSSFISFTDMYGSECQVRRPEITSFYKTTPESRKATHVQQNFLEAEKGY